MKAMRKIGYAVTAGKTAAVYPNCGVGLPCGMAFVLRKNGQKITEHRTHNAAWQWAKRLNSRDIIVAANTVAGFPPIDYSELA